MCKIQNYYFSLAYNESAQCKRAIQYKTLSFTNLSNIVFYDRNPLNCRKFEFFHFCYLYTTSLCYSDCLCYIIINCRMDNVICAFIKITLSCLDIDCIN